MHQSVRDIWIPFNEKLEGVLAFMYADVLNLITTGMGNLVDIDDDKLSFAERMAPALKLSWELPGGAPASDADVAEAWTAVKRDPRCAKEGWTYAVKLPANRVRLSKAIVQRLIMSKLDEHDVRARMRFADWESRPADAQLAAHSMMWAMGSSFWKKFPRFTAAFTRGDYAKAGASVGKDENGVPIYECGIAYPVDAKGKRHYGTIRVRNDRDHQLLLNAAARADDPSVLMWQLPGAAVA